MARYTLGWSRDKRGRVIFYHKKNICNTITTFSCSSHTTSIYIYEDMGNASTQDIKNIPPDCKVRIRKFTPREVGRFMGVRDNKIDILLSCGVSNSALYKMFGNSIIVDNLVAVFNNMFYPELEQKTYKAGEQLTLW